MSSLVLNEKFSVICQLRLEALATPVGCWNLQIFIALTRSSDLQNISKATLCYTEFFFLRIEKDIQMKLHLKRLVSIILFGAPQHC